MSPGTHKALKLAVGVAVGTLVLYFAGRTLVANVEQLRAYDFTFRVDLLAASLGLLLASQAFLPWAWQKLCRGFGPKPSYADAFEVWFLSAITRYVPGKVLTFATQTALAHEKQVPVGIALATAVLLQLFSTVVGAEVFLLTVPFWPGLPIGLKAGALVAAAVLVVLSLQAGVVRYLTHVALRRARVVDARLALTWIDCLVLQLALILSWLVFALAVGLLLNSFGAWSFLESLIVTGTQAGAWLVGYYTFITPGGLGVREGAQILLLKQSLPLTFAVLIPLALRVWLTLGDLLSALMGLLVRVRRRNVVREQ